MDDFISGYVNYMRDTEPPYIYHRWSAIAATGALLGRSYYLQHGHFRVFPNIYCLLLGDPATRKSTAIKLAKKLLTPTGYRCLASTKTSKEQFLHDLELSSEEGFGLAETGNKDPEKFLDTETERALWGDNSQSTPKEVFVIADEFSEFSGVGNAEFYTTLGNIWDWDDDLPFTQRLKNSKSISIWQPTVSILGGTTPSKFAKIFPPEIMDDGFLSRLLIIHGERSVRSYPKPPIPDAEETEKVIDRLRTIRQRNYGSAERDKDAEDILADIYTEWSGLEDARFKSYNSRRYTQLLKLCLISSVSGGTAPVITGFDVIKANTWLTAAETKMAAALGEFGKSRTSDVANKIMDVLNAAVRPLAITELWAHVQKDLERISQLGEITNGLQLAGKIQNIHGRGWLPKKSIRATNTFVDWDLLTPEERLK